jgi:hypothetical protein
VQDDLGTAARQPRNGRQHWPGCASSIYPRPTGPQLWATSAPR